jgi:glycosyltransferase involved in cell wall biosynthesis
MEHESSIWKEKLTRKVLSKGDSFLVTNRKDADKLSTLVPPSHIAVHPIPLPGMFPPAKPDVEKRAGLELLFFGLVRPYKGLDVLIDAMHLLKDEDIFLTVAGEWWQDSAPLRSRIFHKDLAGKIEVIDRYLTDDETAGYFSRADVVVLPYRSATGTGVIPLAYHYGKPVIAADVGGLREVVEDGVSGRMVRPGDPSALASVIRDFLHAPGAITREGVEKVGRRMTWDSLAECLLDLIKDTGE